MGAGRQTQLARTFVAIAPVEGPRASRAGCEVSRALGVRLGLSPVAIEALDDVSDRTVGHHLAHVFDKTGRRTRAGAAVFAIEHGLLPA
jgi:hypothetical protein